MTSMPAINPRTLTRLAISGLAAAALLGLAACGKKVEAVGDDVSMGAPDAKVTVIEYASVACPICAYVNEKTMPDFKKKYVDTGKVRYIYRPMMTGSGPVAAAGHRLAQCAGKDKYFAVVDTIMRRQKEMDQGGAPEQYVNARPVLIDIAKQVGLSEDQFNTCVNDADALKHLNDLNDQARKDGIDGTPAFLVNGKKIDTPQSIADLDAAIQPLLK